jgi:hypothetical protein
MAFGIVSIPATRLEVQSAGMMGLSLTHFDDTAEPNVAAGSWAEIAGAVYEADADTAIAGWGAIAVSSDVYIKLVVAAGAVTPTFTTVAPTWDHAKQGYYDGADRYVGGLRKDAGGNYTAKWIYLSLKSKDRGFIEGAIVVANNGYWTPLEGVYMYFVTTAPWYYELYENGAWRTDANARAYPGALITDGTKVRIKNTTGGNQTVYFVRFA